MTRRNVIQSCHAVTNGNMSTQIISSVINVMFLDNFLIQANATGSPNGEYKVEFSSDYVQDAGGGVINPGTWVQCTLNPQAIITAASNVIIDFNQSPAAYMRVKWVPSGGTGTLNIYVTAKEI